MTRKEALNFLGIYGQITKNQYDVQVDKIYDDFESRICKNCEYWNKYDECEKIYYHDNLANREYIETNEDFSCNKFERKQ